MKNNLLSFPSTLLYDQHCLTKDQAFFPFALTDIFTLHAQKSQEPIIHFWQLENVMILGMKDTRVDDLSSGLLSLKKDGYHTIVRHSGGLGVIADRGVLNLSLIIPQTTKKTLSIDEAYQLMYDWIKQTFETPTCPIKAFEVTKSYCPGTFDLSIDGKKFAGIAQRRIKNGIAIMIYLSVLGNQKKRSNSVKRFYQLSTKNAIKQNGYPEIDASCMETLSSLLKQPLTIEEVKKRLVYTFTNYFSTTINKKTLPKLIESNYFIDEIEKQVDKIKQRNQVITDK